LGRKPIPAKFARSRRVALMLTEDEFAQVEKAQRKMEFATMSDFLRTAALDFAAEQRPSVGASKPTMK